MDEVADDPTTLRGVVDALADAASKPLRPAPLPLSLARVAGVDPPDKEERQRKRREADAARRAEQSDNTHAFGWSGGVPPVMQAGIARHYPRKSATAVACATVRVLHECTRAWFAYQEGATAAFFDLMQFCGLWDLPLPIEVASEAMRLAGSALLNQGHGRPGPHGHPLGAHREALICRLRHEHIAAVLKDGAAQRREDQRHAEELSAGATMPFGAPPEIWARHVAKRNAASDARYKAAALAKARMPAVAGATTVEPEALYRDWLKVAKVRKQEGDPHRWPGPYYLPSEATCHMLRWQDLADAFAALSVESDAPLPFVR